MPTRNGDRAQRTDATGWGLTIPNRTTSMVSRFPKICRRISRGIESSIDAVIQGYVFVLLSEVRGGTLRCPTYDHSNFRSGNFRPYVDSWNPVWTVVARFEGVMVITSPNKLRRGLRGHERSQRVSAALACPQRLRVLWYKFRGIRTQMGHRLVSPPLIYPWHSPRQPPSTIATHTKTKTTEGPFPVQSPFMSLHGS